MRRWTHEDVGGEAALREQLGQRGSVPEAVDVVTDRGGAAEAAQEVALAQQRLADQGFPTGQVAVGLDPPAAGELPPPFGNAPADLVEHLGVVLFDPLVIGGGAGDELEPGVFVHAVERRAEGGLDLLQPLGGLPEPDHVEVAVADHVQAPHRAASRSQRRANWSIRSPITQWKFERAQARICRLANSSIDSRCGQDQGRP
jgi:hypothetical protein